MSLTTDCRFNFRGFFTLAAAVIISSIGCGQILDEIAKSDTDANVAEGETQDGDVNDESNDTVPPTQAAMPVRLSAGAALPQSFPTGTGMSFSVDYQFRDGSPNQSNKYVWVIEGQAGKSLRQPLQLGNKGNLPLIAPQLRPEAGPFSSYIVEISPDGSQRKISNSVDMR